MSFYLLPPVSYQTQQKLKHQVDKKKHKHKHKSEDRTHKKNDLSSDTTTLGTVRSSVKSSKSISTKATAERSIDELSNLDSLSIASQQTSKTKDSKDSDKQSGSKPGSGRRHKNHTYNYTHTSDINDIIKYTKTHRPKHSGSSTYAKSNYTASHYSRGSFSPSEYSSSLYSEPIEQHSQTSGENPQEMEMEMQLLQWPKSGNAHLVSPAITNNGNGAYEYSTPSEHHYSDQDLDGDDDNEDNQLTRVYSDVDSIFSTKEVAPKPKLKLFGN